MDTGCKGSHESVDKIQPSPSHSPNLPFFKNRKCFIIIFTIPQIVGDEASLMVRDYVDVLAGCRMHVLHCYSLATAMQRAGARLSWGTSMEFLMFYSPAHHNDLVHESTHGNLHHQQRVFNSYLRNCRVHHHCERNRPSLYVSLNHSHWLLNFPFSSASSPNGFHGSRTTHTFSVFQACWWHHIRWMQQRYSSLVGKNEKHRAVTSNAQLRVELTVTSSV